MGTQAAVSGASSLETFAAKNRKCLIYKQFSGTGGTEWIGTGLDTSFKPKPLHTAICHEQHLARFCCFVSKCL